MIKYLFHELIKNNEYYFILKCTKCNIKLYDLNGKYYFHDEGFSECKYTCDEYIIKNIIE